MPSQLFHFLDEEPVQSYLAEKPFYTSDYLYWAFLYFSLSTVTFLNWDDQNFWQYSATDLILFHVFHNSWCLI